MNQFAFWSGQFFLQFLPNRDVVAEQGNKVAFIGRAVSAVYGQTDKLFVESQSQAQFERAPPANDARRQVRPLLPNWEAHQARAWAHILKTFKATQSVAPEFLHPDLISASCLVLHMEKAFILEDKELEITAPLTHESSQEVAGLIHSTMQKVDASTVPEADEKELFPQITLAYVLSACFQGLWFRPPHCLIQGVKGDILRTSGTYVEMFQALEELAHDREQGHYEDEHLDVDWKVYFMEDIEMQVEKRFQDEPFFDLVKKFIDGIPMPALIPVARQRVQYFNKRPMPPIPLIEAWLALVRACINSIRVIYLYLGKFKEEGKETCGCLHSAWFDHRLVGGDIRTLLTHMVLAAAPQFDQEKAAGHKHICSRYGCSTLETQEQKFIPCTECIEAKLQLRCQYCSLGCLHQDKKAHALFHEFVKLAARHKLNKELRETFWLKRTLDKRPSCRAGTT